MRLPRSVEVRAVLGDADSHASNRVDGCCLTERDVTERFLLAGRADILCHHAATRSRTGKPTDVGHGVAGRWGHRSPVAAHWVDVGSVSDANGTPKEG